MVSGCHRGFLVACCSATTSAVLLLFCIENASIFGASHSLPPPTFHLATFHDFVPLLRPAWSSPPNFRRARLATTLVHAAPYNVNRIEDNWYHERLLPWKCPYTMDAHLSRLFPWHLFPLAMIGFDLCNRDARNRHNYRGEVYGSLHCRSIKFEWLSDTNFNERVIWTMIHLLLTD